MDILKKNNKDKIDNNDKRCSPHISFDGISCIQLHSLVEMAKAYNKFMDKNAIKLNDKDETLDPVQYKKYLIKQFDEQLGDTCSTQNCWTKQDFIKYLKKSTHDEVKKYTFRPPGPEGKFEWLNTFNINDVMTQYEKKHPDFKYLGTVPMDFDSLPQLGLKNLKVKDLHEKGIKQIGLVLNLDNHNEDGSHWVGLYAHFQKGVYYFDSYGANPEPRVRELMKRIYKQCKKDLGCKDYTARYNKIRHQYKNSECGVYSMNFIERMLEEEQFNNICESKTSDDDIHKYRKKYFLNT